MQDITLVNLAWRSPYKKRKTGNKTVPIGPLYLISALEESNYDVDFRDYQLNTFKNPMDIDNFLYFLRDSSDIVGISCMYDLLPFAILSVKRLKETYPEKTVIFGGSGVDGVAKDILETFSFIDIIAIGEGERTIVELMSCLTSPSKRDLSNIHGIMYRDGDKVRVNTIRERIRNLDKVAFPAYHKINIEDYTQTGIITSRGCPYNCTFCHKASYQNYQRSVDNIIEEIRLLYDGLGYECIYIFDDTFVLDECGVLELCKRLKEERLDIEWHCCCRINLMNKKLMTAMADSNCKSVFYGVESGSNAVLQKIKKDITWENAERVITESLKYFDISASFMWGFPFETMNDFYKTLYAIHHLSKIGANVQFTLLSPSPVSPIYRDYKAILRFSDVLWSSNLGFYEDTHIAHILNKNRDTINLIKKYPNIFPGFYFYENDNVYRKNEIRKSIPWIFTDGY